jgi:hypothetical protein
VTRRRSCIAPLRGRRHVLVGTYAPEQRPCGAARDRGAKPPTPRHSVSSLGQLAHRSVVHARPTVACPEHRAGLAPAARSLRAPPFLCPARSVGVTHRRLDQCVTMVRPSRKVRASRRRLYVVTPPFPNVRNGTAPPFPSQGNLPSGCDRPPATAAPRLGAVLCQSIKAWGARA